MRILLSVAFLLLCSVALPAQEQGPRNFLTPDEIAQGKVLLFDGKTTAGWIIEGDAEVKNGVLILGGNQKTRVRIGTDFGPNFELHLEYSTENRKPIQFEWHHREFMGQGMGSMSLGRTSKKPGEWIEAIFSAQASHAGNGWSNACQWRVVGEPDFTEQSLGGSANVPDSAFVAFEIPAGQKLYLRNVRVRADPVKSFPWLLGITATAAVVLLIVAFAVWAIMKKRALHAQDEVPTKVPPP
jgi:hypothetical protein